MSFSPDRFEAEGYSEHCRLIRDAGERLLMGGYDRIVFTNGCFDILHLGHLAVLKHCFDLRGGRGAVVVGLNSDECVRRIKGDERPILDEVTRASILVSLKFVDHVVTFGEDTPIKLIEALQPDVIVKGGDYEALNVVGRKIAQVSIAPLVPGQSSSDIVRRIRER
ncbi:MAG: adenylyltransferase/cytidyltransferase family protein [Acidiferrobacterales bacterium]